MQPTTRHTDSTSGDRPLAQRARPPIQGDTLPISYATIHGHTPHVQGRAWRMEWEAYRCRETLPGRTFMLLYAKDVRTGATVPRVSVRPSGRRDMCLVRKVGSIQDVYPRLRRMYWACLSDLHPEPTPTPLTELQRRLREQTEARAREAWAERRREKARRTWDVQTERHEARTLNRLVRR